MQKAEKLYRFLVYLLPGVLFFSYQPLMHFGSSESMNFEISLPLLWLVVFDVLALVMMVQRKVLFKGLKNKWVFLLLPIFLTVSVFWSLNALRGLLTVGVLWLIYFAVYSFWSLRSLFRGVGFWEKFWKVFFGSTLVICGWCLVQCVLDLCGVSREVSLMCAGCTYQMFGFPHPNGFAIEPQFMGNLLIAPLIISGYFVLKNKKYLIIFFVFAMTLFLTFSRGAIYAFVVGMVMMTVWELVRRGKEVMKRLGVTWLVMMCAFGMTLCMQGVMAAVSPTNDTFQSGVAKVLNHLSLGVIDIRGPENVGITGVEIVENPVENFDNQAAAFDGYVAESTDTRLRLSGAAFQVWHQDLTTAMFGVGLGGAGQALYINGLSSAPKEIVQNQYASLLLESGIVGVVLTALSLALVIRAIWKSEMRVVLICLGLAYMISLVFFSGLPNALQIYLLPALIYAMGLRKKFVS